MININTAILIKKIIIIKSIVYALIYHIFNKCFITNIRKRGISNFIHISYEYKNKSRYILNWNFAYIK